MECLGVAAGSYYDAVPLLFIRLLQLQLYGVVYNRSAGYLAEGRLKLAVLTDSIEPHGARSPLQQRSIDAALQGYQLCGRSGFYDVASRGAQPAWTPKASDPNRSLHMHLHLTHHGGTTMGIMALRGTCQLLGGSMGHAAIIDVHGGDPSQIQRELLSLETNASVRFDECRNFGFACRTTDSRCLDCQRFHNASMDGRAPPLTTSRLVDFGQFEPRLPLNAPVPSDRIVWSTNVRHPTLWSAVRYRQPEWARDAPNFMLSRWLSTSFRSDACAVRAILAGDNSVDQCPAAGRPTRLHLTRAKELARGMAIIQDVDTYEADATLLCQLLKWPSSACRPSAFTPGGKASTKHHTQVMRCTCMQPCLAPQWCWPVITRVCRMHCRSTPTS